MPKQAFGGDDDTEYEVEEGKKPKLSKFGLRPDANIRDVFWKVMASYATTKNAGINPKKIYEHRFTFIKIARSLLERKESHYYGMSPQFIVRYLMMLFLDNGWTDAAAQLLAELKEGKEKSWMHAVHAIRYLIKTEKYRAGIIRMIKALIRDTEAYPVALFYIANLKSREVAEETKKELYIFARGDTEENQRNAIDSIGMLKNDEEATKMIITLLGHWDAEIRKTAARYLRDMKLNKEMAKMIENKFDSETDEEVKKILKKAMKWKK